MMISATKDKFDDLEERLKYFSEAICDRDSTQVQLLDKLQTLTNELKTAQRGHQIDQISDYASRDDRAWNTNPDLWAPPKPSQDERLCAYKRAKGEVAAIEGDKSCDTHKKLLDHTPSVHLEERVKKYREYMKR